MKETSIDNLLKKNKLLEKRNKELEISLFEKKNRLVPVSLDQMYQTLFRLSPNSIIVSRVEDGTIYDISDYFCRVTGFSREEAIGKTTVELNLWLDHDREKIVKILSRNGRFQNLEMKHRMKDGTIKTCLDSGEMIMIGDEQYLISIETDITDRKQAEDALRESETKYRELVKYAPAGIYEIDHETGHLKSVNDIICEYTGYTREELLNMNLNNLLTEESQKCMAERIEKLFAGKEIPQSVEYCIKTKNGEKLWVIVSPRYIYEGGKFKGVSGIIYNITERKRSENELKRFAENLEDANIALRVLMNKRNLDQKDFEEKLQVNINDLVIPYLTKLSKEDLDDRGKNYLSVLESNLSDVLSPFMRDFRSSQKNLTPQEIQIVDLIMKGNNTKEIADMLNASVNTVATHRNNIRKKLNLRNSKINLRSYILSLK